jgi:hypothetical protein
MQMKLILYRWTTWKLYWTKLIWENSIWSAHDSLRNILEPTWLLIVAYVYTYALANLWGVAWPLIANSVCKRINSIYIQMQQTTHSNVYVHRNLVNICSKMLEHAWPLTTAVVYQDTNSRYNQSSLDRSWQRLCTQTPSQIFESLRDRS